MAHANAGCAASEPIARVMVPDPVLTGATSSEGAGGSRSFKNPSDIQRQRTKRWGALGWSSSVTLLRAARCGGVYEILVGYSWRGCRVHRESLPASWACALGGQLTKGEGGRREGCGPDGKMQKFVVRAETACM